MNVNDTEILNSILTNSGYVRTSSLEDANVVFLVTVSRTALYTPNVHDLHLPTYIIFLVCDSRKCRDSYLGTIKVLATLPNKSEQGHPTDGRRIGMHG